MKAVVITGVSTGIGRACADVLLKKGCRVFGSVRRREDAERAQSEFGSRFTPLLFDVTDAGAVGAAAASVGLALAGEYLFGLVNNAGIAVAGPLLHLDVNDFRHQLEVNVTGQLIVTQAFAPLLAQNRTGAPGRIVMMSSVGGRTASPFLGPYNASKFALEGLSESLRRELMLLGIDVIVVAPGTIATPIWDKAETIDVAAYAATPFGASLKTIRDYMVAHGREGLAPERIGLAVWRALSVPRPRTRYVVTPDGFRNFLATVLPRRMLDRLIARQLARLAKG